MLTLTPAADSGDEPFSAVTTIVIATATVQKRDGAAASGRVAATMAAPLTFAMNSIVNDRGWESSIIAK